MSAKTQPRLTVLDCRLLDGRKAVVSFADLGIRTRRARDATSQVYTSRIRLVPVSNDPKSAETRYSRVPVDLAEESGDAQGFRAACDKAVMEGLGIDVLSLFE